MRLKHYLLAIIILLLTISKTTAKVHITSSSINSTAVIDTNVIPSDTILCKGDFFEVSIIPNNSIYEYSFEAINSSTGVTYYLGSVPTYYQTNIDKLKINTEAILSEGLYTLKITTFISYFTIGGSYLLKHKIKVNAVPQIVLNDGNTSFGGQYAGMENIDLKMIKGSGKLPFAVRINGSIELVMEKDTFNYEYPVTNNQSLKIENLIDANGCMTDEIPIGYRTIFYNDLIVSPKISTRRVTGDSNRNFCKGEILEVRLDVRGTIPDGVQFMPKIKEELDRKWTDVVVLKDSLGWYWVKLPDDIAYGKYSLTFMANNLETKVLDENLNSENRILSEFYITPPNVAKLLSGNITINKREAFTLRVKISSGFSVYKSSFIPMQQVKIRTNYGDEFSVQTNRDIIYINIDTLTRNTTYFISDFRLVENSINSPNISYCEPLAFMGSISVNVKDRGSNNFLINSITFPNGNCGGAKFRVNFSKIGTTPTSNLKIQLKTKANFYDDLSTYYDVPTTFISNTVLEGTLPIDSTIREYNVRVVTEDLDFVGSPYIRLNIANHPVSMQLSGEAFVTPSQVPSVFVSIPIEYDFLGRYYNFGFTDGISNWSYSDVRFTREKEISLRAFTEFSAPASINISPTFVNEAVCGNGMMVGSAKINIIPSPRIQISLDSSNLVCVSEKLYISYNIDTTFHPNKTYKLVFRYRNSDIVFSEFQVFITEKTGKIESNLPIGSAINFDLVLISESPYMVSNIIQIDAKLRPSVRVTAFYNPSPGLIKIDLEANGTPPFKVKWDDGDYEYIANSNQKVFSIYVSNSEDKTRNIDDSKYYFTIKSIEDMVCEAPINHQDVFSLPQKSKQLWLGLPNKLAVCGNESVKFFYQKNLGINNLTLQFFNPSTKIFEDLNSTITSDTIYLDNYANIPTEKQIYFRLKGSLSGNNVFSSSLLIPFIIRTSTNLPTANLLSQTLIQKTENQLINLKVNLTGSAPWYLKYSVNNQPKQIVIENNPYYIKHEPTLNQFSVYQLISVKNSCGNGSVSGSSQVIKANLDVLPFSFENTNFCVQGKLKFYIQKIGSLQSFMKFQLILENDNKPDQVFELPFTYLGNDEIEITLPNWLPVGTDKNNTKWYKIRVVCTSPNLVGDFTKYINLTFYMKIWGDSPTLSFSESKTIIKGESTIVSLKTDKYIEGIEAIINTNYYRSLAFTNNEFVMPVTPQKDTTFSINSISHSTCNINIGNPSTTTIFVKFCSTNLDVNTDINQGEIKSLQSSNLNAINKIMPQSKATFNGEKSILLNAGFEAKQGSIFKAQIQPCIDNSN